MKMNISVIIRAGLAMSLPFAMTVVHAHIVLEHKSATAGSYYKATFMVGHGCDGSPTTGIEIEMPEAMAVVKPKPKPGWQVTTQTMPQAIPMSLHGRPVKEIVNRVIWHGGPLPDGHYDEFVVLMQLPNRAGRLHFKVVQHCETGRSDWIEIPAMGTEHLKLPAPVLELQPAAPIPHH